MVSDSFRRRTGYEPPRHEARARVRERRTRTPTHTRPPATRGLPTCLRLSACRQTAALPHVRTQADTGVERGRPRPRCQRGRKERDTPTDSLRDHGMGMGRRLQYAFHFVVSLSGKYFPKKAVAVRIGIF